VRAALDAGSDPTVVAGWIDEVRREEADAERRLVELRQAPDRLEVAEIRSAVEQVGGLVPILRKRAPADRAAFYEAVELRGDFDPHQRTVAMEARVRMVRVGGATATIGHACCRRCRPALAVHPPKGSDSRAAHGAAGGAVNRSPDAGHR
jgi:hypothetical protein